MRRGHKYVASFFLSVIMRDMSGKSASAGATTRTTGIITDGTIMNRGCTANG